MNIIWRRMRRDRPQMVVQEYCGRQAALVVGDAHTSGSVLGAEDSVLLEQVVDDRRLLSVNPARDQEEQEDKRVRPRVHSGSVSQRAT